jgi:hypothetical protein
MKALRSFWLSALSLALAACKPDTQLPVRTGYLEGSVESEPDRVVCHAHALAAALGMRFHYGTFKDGDGSKATIRLTGEDYELNLAKWSAREPYQLRAYDMSEDGSGRSAAEQAFDRFRRDFTSRIGQACQD